MTTNFSIHFSDEGVVFRHLHAGRVWSEIGRLNHGDSWNSVALNVIRRRAIRLGCGNIAATLITFRDSVSYTYLTPVEGGREQTESVIRQHLGMLSDQKDGRFAFDWTVDDQIMRIAYADLEELEKQGQFVTEFGFPVVGYAAVQNDRDDFPAGLMLGVSDFGKSRDVTADGIRTALACPGRSHDVHGVHRSVFAQNPARALAAAAVAGILAFASVSLDSDPASATGADSGLAGTRALSTLSGSSNTAAANRGTGTDANQIHVVEGWQSAIAAQPVAFMDRNDGQSPADRGFDPTTLQFELLELAAVTVPNGHDLLPRVPAYVPEQNTGVQDLQTVFADPALTSSSEPDPAAATDQLPILKLDEQSLQQESGIGQDSADSAAEGEPAKPKLLPLQIGRPVLRDGARHKTRVLTVSRPVLRRGARDPAPDQLELADAQQTSESSDELARSARLERLEAEVTPRESFDVRPLRRPQAPEDTFCCGRRSGGWTCASCPQTCQSGNSLNCQRPCCKPGPADSRN